MPKDRKKDKKKKRKRDSSSSPSRSPSRERSRRRRDRRSRSRSRSRSRDRDRRRDSPSRSSAASSSIKRKEETPEERARRKAEKRAKKSALAQKEKELFGYSAENNVFGDRNLTEVFVWKKKIERDIQKGVDPRSLTKAALKNKQLTLREEIEAARRAREQREIERLQMEEQRELERRGLFEENIEGWEKKEEEFHQKMAKKRSEIRIREGREKPIDVLAKNLYIFHADDRQDDRDAPSIELEVELAEPYRIFEGLSLQDAEQLRTDIAEQKDLAVSADAPEADKAYWAALLTVADDEVSRARGIAKGLDVKLPERVRREVSALMDGKSTQQLDLLQRDIVRKLDMGGGPAGEAIDVPYWESLLKQLTVYRAKAHLREFHAELLQRRLEQLKTQQRLQRLMEGRAEAEAEMSDEDRASDDEEGEGEERRERLRQQLLLQQQQRQRGAGAGEGDGEAAVARAESPVLLRESDLDPAALSEVLDEDEDAALLAVARRRVLEEKKREEVELLAKSRAEVKARAPEIDPATALANAGMNRFMLTADQLFEQEASRRMEDDEVKFSEEIQLSAPDQPYWWHDKYRPRKPRFFNRVKTGFEWNKYNQTHYDKENPPPKTVQGYKFNIFYPDLIDTSKPPTYRLEEIPGEPDYCIIRFMAGPPYEDIAFKIVRKEWEYSHRHGFKCVFERGVLQLYFNFRRFRYRR